MAEDSQVRGKGLLKSLSVFVTTFLTILHTRFELLSIDLEQERDHLFSLIILILTGLFSLGVGVVLMSIAIIVTYWDSHRLLALGILGCMFLAAAMTTGVIAIYKIRNRPRMLEATLQELSKDLQQVDPRT